MSAARQPSGRRRRRLSAGAVAALEILVLGLTALALTAFVFPDLFEIEPECLTSVGVVTTSGTAYVDAVVVVGTFGWLAVAIATIYASIADRTRLLLGLPIAWFVSFVLATFVTGWLVGPAACTS